MAVDELDKLKGELAALKKQASDQSADLMRASKEIGARDNEIAALAAVRAENDQLKAENADLASQLKAAKSALDAAAKAADANAAKVAAAEQIAAGLRAL